MIYNLFYKFFKKNIVILILYLASLLYLPINKLGMPHIYGKLISKLKEGIVDNSLYYFILLVVLWFVIQSMKIISNYLRANILPKFNAYVREQLINTIIDKYKTNYEDLELGKTITKIIKTPYLLSNIFDNLEDFLFRNIIIIVTSFVYLFVYNKTLAVIYLICMCCIVVVCFLFSKSCTKFSIKSDDTYDNVHEKIEDTLSNMISIYTSQKINYEKKRIKKLSYEIFENDKKLSYCENKYRLIYTSLFILIFIILNGYTYYIYTKKEIKLETLISIIIINYSLLNSFMYLFYDTRNFISIKGKLDVFSKYINNLPHSTKDNILKIKNTNNLKITFKNVNFYYKKDKPVLNDFNLTINNNEIVALIGTIGSGKSTIAKLLVRLKDYKSGNILISKYDIKNINLDSLRSVITYIPQHPKLFNRTLYHNLVYGVNKKITEEEIFTILDKLNMKTTTDILKKKMYKNVGKNGSNLSGGQRQIVWLVRAVLKNSKVIILDEPTSSLDKHSKTQVIEFIKNFCNDKILLIITHDKELLKYVNRVIKLDKGKIISDVKK